MTQQKILMLSGVALAGSGVILGAFAAHALKGKLSTSSLAAFQTGVQYQFIHALALICVALAMARSTSTDPATVSSSFFGWAGYCFLTGVVLFSGSLYVLSLTQIRWAGPVTPLGGLAFIAGWALLFLAVLKDY